MDPPQFTWGKNMGLKMSPRPSPFPETSSIAGTTARPAGVTFDVSEANGKKMPDVRRQAIAAIEVLMGASGPEYAQEQEQLRVLVEAHPGQPEIALAKHILTARPYLETRGDGGRTLAPGTDSGRH